MLIGFLVGRMFVACFIAAVMRKCPVVPESLHAKDASVKAEWVCSAEFAHSLESHSSVAMVAMVLVSDEHPLLALVVLSVMTVISSSSEGKSDGVKCDAGSEGKSDGVKYDGGFDGEG